MTAPMDSQRYQLAIPFPASLVKQKPGSNARYVPHHVYTQRLLVNLGSYDFEVVQVLRGMVVGTPPDPNGSSARAKRGTPDLPDAVVGVLCRLTVVVDGERQVVEEVGDCEQPHNWTTDGARLKDAMSDALKRCCMRIGMGVHLYAKEPSDFVLRDALRKKLDATPADEPDDDEIVVGVEDADHAE